ncbi:hypothetical protein GQ43DRAFT_440899 [Delitschia confertaspora ATCC 74209]|uniref:Borealin N-terminal domain-containing protein n=1 Tax=Delitschia confertaspora ATCC 74209 TaxID=1513339 RepID=A0A9P4MS50_9PLEO|nr:hypothetical protein GQ43DRAFT_440899 [Delitschia confertaspora ATCC 74209]
MALSSEEKAAMIANLRNEVNSRAEKLTLMYKTQMDTLRSRLERRVNRIPNTWREINIMELVEKYAEEPKKVAPASTEKPAPRAATSRPNSRQNNTAQPSRAKGIKRTSNEMASDKENQQAEQLSVPKKRVRAATTTTRTAAPKAAQPAPKAPARTTRAASRKNLAAPTGPEVLSPKSSNSRTVAQSRARRQR